MAYSKHSNRWLLAAALVFGCQTTPQDEGGDRPATPIAQEDAAQELAELLCTQLSECECGASFTDHATCVEEMSTALATQFDSVLDAGGTWDPDCAGKWAKAVADWECLGPTSAGKTSYFEPRACPMLRGTLGLGEQCNYSMFGDECKDGLSCFSSMCVESVTLPVPLGQTCESGWENLACESGSYCGYDNQSNTRRCLAVPSEGDSCDEYLCGPSGNLLCLAGTCELAPGEGELCYDGFYCRAGFYCDGGKDFTCQPLQEIGEGCGADAVCPVDSSCIGNICQADAPAVCNSLAWVY